jgi:hypothetical protein
MNSALLLSLQLGEALDLLDTVVGDLTPAQYAWQPDGTANPISKLHVHTLTSVDFWANAMGTKTPPLWPKIAEKTGLPANAIKVWETTTPIVLADMLDYANGIRAAALPAIESLSDEALAREVDTPFFGKRDVAFVLRLAASQLSTHTGEIAAIKGLQGLKGLPY